ncbi:hypothetical protein D9615_000344 [Tricholomella constricta]|uniref:Ubiquitin-like-conjugating enzyme ATG10 n=1 Tax=Tricholomella constricta TaxID=117010 RepID=A0A8H5MAX2_9AGAR|nr:hypothetical protein D9615_000344 [Tricholomella constricta]
MIAVGIGPQRRTSRHLDGLSFEVGEADDLAVLSFNFLPSGFKPYFTSCKAVPTHDHTAPSHPIMLTRVQFEAACKELIATERPVEALNGWSWNEHPSLPNLGFLSRRVFHFRTTQSTSIDSMPTDGVDLEETLFEEDEAASAIAPESFVSCQYVVYSATFQVPAFYFTMHDPKGAPLALANLVRTSLFHPFVFEQTEATSFGLTRPASAFPLLSQGDHPALGTPCWYLHPCETAKCVDELMSELDLAGYAEEQRFVRWLEMWFMVLGSTVNVRS